MDYNQVSDRFAAIHYVLKHAKPHGLEVECIDDLIYQVSSPHFDGNWMQAANCALSEWDI
jgi:hypothetical protein